MSRKLIRLVSHDQIRNRAKEFLNKKINIVLKSNDVTFGVLQRISDNDIIIQNLRHKTMVIPIISIDEICIDVAS